MKKIIVFSVFGSNPIYVDGAYRNLLDQKKFYSDWICRFYVDDLVPKDKIALLEKDAEVIVMPRSDGFYGMWWRFEPLKDTSLERFIVRDTDSQIIQKEVSAVNEWIKNGKEFHIMRDHRYHTQPIMGGMWGATSEFINKYKDFYDKEKQEFLSTLSFEDLFHSSGKYYQTDQAFLQRYIWPRIINSHTAHIAPNRPGLRFTGNESLFPEEDPEGFFVAWQYYHKNTPGYFNLR